MTKKSRKPVAAPVYAAVGAADLAIEQLKKTLVQVEALADSIREDIEQRAAQANADAHDAAARAGKAAHDAPEQVLNRGLTVASVASHAYDQMTQRGQRVVGRGFEGVREDKRVKEATKRAGSTVKAATDTAATVRGFAGKAMGKKDSAAVTVTGSVVEGQQPESTPVKNVGAAVKDKPADKPATPRKRTAKRATTVADTTPTSTGDKPATKRPSRASVTAAGAGKRTATASTPRKRTAKAPTHAPSSATPGTPSAAPTTSAASPVTPAPSSSATPQPPTE